MSAFPDEPLLDESETLSDASHSGSEDSETGGVDAAGLDKMMALLGSDADLGFDSQEEEDEEDSEAEGSDDDDQEELEQPAVTSHKGKEKARQDANLEKVLAKFKLPDIDFFDTQTLTHPTDLDIPDANNDLERELQFYKQSLWAANKARSLFVAADKPFARAPDYFAEMLKSDTHMERIRSRLLDEAAGIKASEEAKKLRHAKKFGKSVQQAKLVERSKEKKAMGEKVKEFKKKRKTGEDAGSDNEFDISLDSRPEKKQRTESSSRGGRGGSSDRGGRGGKPRISRDARDSKYGFGHGEKNGGGRFRKENTRESAEDFGGGRGGRGGSRGRGSSSRGSRGSSRGASSRGGSSSRGKARPGKSKR